MRKFYLIVVSIIFILPTSVLAGKDDPRDAIAPLPTANLTQEFQFGNIKNMGVLAKGFFPIAFEFAMIALLIYTLVGAFKFLVSGGDKEAVANARKMITHAVVGFFLLILLFLIFQYLPKALGFNFAVF